MFFIVFNTALRMLTFLKKNIFLTINIRKYIHLFIKFISVDSTGNQYNPINNSRRIEALSV